MSGNFNIIMNIAHSMTLGVWSTPDIMTGAVSGKMYGVAVNTSGFFAAVGGNASNIPVAAYSSDGIQWYFPLPMGGTTSIGVMNAIAVNSSGRFVAVGSSYSGGGASVSYSDDGINWAIPFAISSPTGLVTLLCVTVNSSGRFVALGRGPQPTGSSNCWSTYSDDGITWSTVTNIPGAIRGSLNGIAVNSSGLFVAIGDDDHSPYPNLVSTYSSDGITWNTITVAGSNCRFARGIAVNSIGRFVTTGVYGGDLRATYSDDGITWKPITTVTTSSFQFESIAVNYADKFVAVGYIVGFDDPAVMESGDGITWSAPIRMNGSTSFAQMYGVAVNSTGLFAAVGFESHTWAVASYSFT